MHDQIKHQPTIGFISTWPVYQGTTIDRYARSLIQGISAAASEQACNLLLGCGFSATGNSPQHRSFWPAPGPHVNFVPVGPWNTDGLIIVPDELTKEQSQYVRDLLDSGFPVIFTTPEGPGAVVAVDNTLGIRQAILALPALYLILLRINLLNTHTGLVLIYACGAIAFNVWNTKGYFDTLPFNLEEAAIVDGATPTQAFLRVALPLARPVLAITALLGFLAGFGDFILADTVLFNELLYTAPVGVFTLQVGYRNPWGWFAASALLLATPVTILFLYLQRHLDSGLAAGGVKG